MKVTSKTGLLASPIQTKPKKLKQKSVQLKAIAIPAPVIFRPYADLYNPYPYGCSLLCNHPTDKEAKDILKRARETWATENKNIISPEELQAIRDSLANIEKPEPLPVDNIPEELFRRYTQTDSRPLTPAPTLASVKTRGSSSRRCVTPDPIITSVLHERTLLILDLRRSHSQEVISWHGTNEVPVINVLRAPTPSVSIESPSETPEIPSRKTTASSKLIVQQQKLEVPQVQQNKVSVENILEFEYKDNDEEEVVKRKGKRRKKRGRDSSRGPLAVQASIDPETQVSALGPDCLNPSVYLSLDPTDSLQDSTAVIPNQRKYGQHTNYNLPNSILEPNILKRLQRELTSEIVDLEFNKMKRAALEEAFRVLPAERKPHPEVIQLKKKLNLPPINETLWLSLPRVFSRRSARFELPLHSKILGTLTPLEYLKQHCVVSNGRKMLYNMVFNRHKDLLQEKETCRVLLVDNIRIALGEMMGKPITDDQIIKFQQFVDWTDDDVIDFKTWCGMCAFFERVFAVEFCPQLLGKDMDPCNEIEVADFQSLFRRLQYVTPKESLVKMLHAIKDL